MTHVPAGRPSILLFARRKNLTRCVSFPSLNSIYGREERCVLAIDLLADGHHQNDTVIHKPMRVTSLPFWLTCTRIASSTRAFTTLSKALTFGSILQTSESTRSLYSTQKQFSTTTTSTTTRFQNSIDKMAVTDMERGVGGRIEAAFEAAKAKGEAAFVTFITAGYPTAQGMFPFFFVFILVASTNVMSRKKPMQ